MAVSYTHLFLNGVGIVSFMMQPFSCIQVQRETTQGTLGKRNSSCLLYTSGGEKHASIQLEQIKDKAKQYTPDEERRKQITALLFKYKQGLSCMKD